MAVAHTPGEALVARLLAIVGGDAPMSDATRLLAPDVICHMDQYTARGVDAWVDWVEFIAARSRRPVVVDVERYVTNANGIVTVYGCLRVRNAARTTPCQGEARYRLEHERIAEIWTSRANYEIIFGATVRHPLRWLLVLVQLAVWRRLPWRRRAHLIPDQGSSDRAGNEPRRSGEADGDPERRRTD